MQRQYAALLKPLGLTYLQYLVMLVLFEGDGLTVGQVGRRLHLDSGTLTPVLRRLERVGFVERRRASDDEREVRITLTTVGRSLEADLDGVRSEIACRAALGPDAFAGLRHDLRALHGRLAGAGGSIPR